MGAHDAGLSEVGILVHEHHENDLGNSETLFRRAKATAAGNALWKVRQLAKINAASWQADQRAARTVLALPRLQRHGLNEALDQPPITLDRQILERSSRVIEAEASDSWLLPESSG
jgi:hypothetical protein